MLIESDNYTHKGKCLADKYDRAEGYILKNTPPEEILDGIQEIHEGGAPMTPAIALKVMRMFKQNLSGNKDDSFNLSNREKEILKCLVEGMSYKLIAGGCFISIDTVHGHIKNIHKKIAGILQVRGGGQGDKRKDCLM